MHWSSKLKAFGIGPKTGSFFPTLSRHSLHVAGVLVLQGWERLGGSHSSFLFPGSAGYSLMRVSFRAFILF